MFVDVCGLAETAPKGFTGFYWVSMRFTGFSSASLRFTGFYRFIGFYGVLFGLKGF